MPPRCCFRSFCSHLQVASHMRAVTVNYLYAGWENTSWCQSEGIQVLLCVFSQLACVDSQWKFSPTEVTLSSLAPCHGHSSPLSASSPLPPSARFVSVLQLSAVLADVGLNIREAHVFSTSDGFSLDVFVVDGWPSEVRVPVALPRWTMYIVQGGRYAGWLAGNVLGLRQRQADRRIASRMRCCRCTSFYRPNGRPTANKLAGGQAGRQADRLSYGLSYRRSYRQASKQTSRHTGCHTGGQAGREDVLLGMHADERVVQGSRQAPRTIGCFVDPLCSII